MRMAESGALGLHIASVIIAALSWRALFVGSNLEHMTYWLWLLAAVLGLAVAATRNYRYSWIVISPVLPSPCSTSEENAWLDRAARRVVELDACTRADLRTYCCCCAATGWLFGRWCGGDIPTGLFLAAVAGVVVYAAYYVGRYFGISEFA